MAAKRLDSVEGMVEFITVCLDRARKMMRKIRLASPLTQQDPALDSIEKGLDELRKELLSGRAGLVRLGELRDAILEKVGLLAKKSAMPGSHGEQSMQIGELLTLSIELDKATGRAMTVPEAVERLNQALESIAKRGEDLLRVEESLKLIQLCRDFADRVPVNLGPAVEQWKVVIERAQAGIMDDNHPNTSLCRGQALSAAQKLYACIAPIGGKAPDISDIIEKLKHSPTREGYHQLDKAFDKVLELYVSTPEVTPAAEVRPTRKPHE